MMKFIHNFGQRKLSVTLLVSSLTLIPLTSIANTTDLNFLDQGKKWSNKERLEFYSQDQGSQIMPLKWMQALKQANGQPFMADSLSRYGYLPNPGSPTPGLPVGFTINDNHIGMNCSACHTRQISVDGQQYRIDGGPAFTDFQTFASDLDASVNNILNNKPAFNAFANAVLGKSASAKQKADLNTEVKAWYLAYHTLMDKALPKDKPWGPARLDAVGMIFGRLTGLDIGTTPDHMIPGNIRLADAPTRYPFLWNASIQDITQWPGFADNGNDLLALSRNLGEVIGVFDHFYPKEDKWRILGIDYLSENSANFKGLKKLEDHIKQIGPPQWPWKVDAALAASGKAIYESTTKTEDGGCNGCHGIRKGQERRDPFPHDTWATPLCDVGTDTREINNIVNFTVDTGVLAGKQVPFLTEPLKATGEPAIKVLGLAVIGSILQNYTPLIIDLEEKVKKDVHEVENRLGIENDKKVQELLGSLLGMQKKLITKENASLEGAFRSFSKDSKTSKPTASVSSNCKSNFDDPKPVMAFESRVMQGVWAVAPYLHNGSVPTLDDLLKPAAERPASFKVGPNYDLNKIGLAVEQDKFNYQLKTTDCSDLNSGNSRCGHEYGTKLSADEKKALLEYLKTL